MPPTILIVEDTQSLAMMYQAYLLPTGVNTLLANDGATALHFAAGDGGPRIQKIGLNLSR